MVSSRALYRAFTGSGGAVMPDTRLVLEDPCSSLLILPRDWIPKHMKPEVRQVFTYTGDAWYAVVLTSSGIDFNHAMR